MSHYTVDSCFPCSVIPHCAQLAEGQYREAAVVHDVYFQTLGHPAFGWREIMINLKDTIDSVCRKATRHKPFEFNVVTLESAKEIIRPNCRFRITKPDYDHISVTLINDLPHSSVPLNLGPVYSRAGMISSTAFAKTQYANVADDPIFHLLYDVQPRSLAYIEAGTPINKPTLSAPCMICGLVLPLRNLTVDHQRPQSGGEIEAVLKTLRAFGLTNEGPKGPKGQAILRHFTKATPLGPVLTQPSRVALGGTNLADRYTLNDVGAILYSFVAAAGQKAELQSQCMHGLLNLKPACQTCNSSRGNPLKF